MVEAPGPGAWLKGAGIDEEVAPLSDRNAVSMESACELCSCYSVANHPRCDWDVHRFPLDGTQRR
jgi:hypothetical protein